MTHSNNSDSLGYQVDAQLARKIDHTLLKPDATPEKIKTLCQEAIQYHFASVCVNPAHVRLCASLLKGFDVKVCTVIGFPLGANTTETKVFEAINALENGATEVDMVINIGALKAQNDSLVKSDIHAVAESIHLGGGLLKVIIETSLLSEEEKKRACRLAQGAGADFVKTSTGFNGGGATLEDIKLMRQTVGPVMGVKASGGIHTHQQALELIVAGATRIGASAGLTLIRLDAAEKPAGSGKDY